MMTYTIAWFPLRRYRGNIPPRSMARPAGVKRFLYAIIIAFWALSGGAAAAKPLRLVTELGPLEDVVNGKKPGFDIEVVRTVFAAMGRDTTFEVLPPNRAWMMLVRGEVDGLLGQLRIGGRERFCSFPDEPLVQAKWVVFVRAADIGKLKFSSFDDFIGHDVAVSEPVPGLTEQLTLPAKLSRFLREHHNGIETSGNVESLRMLAAGRVDYAVLGLRLGRRLITKMGLSGKVEPLLSRSVFEGGVYVCFSKAQVSPALVEAFSRTLKQFKQTAAFQTLYLKYYPALSPTPSGER
jgi:polar amino acid transport system substrate-binding protein